MRFTHITPGHWTFIHVLFQLLFLEHTALAAISALGTNLTHCHFCPTRYSFTPESSGTCVGKVPCPMTQHRNNVPILRGDKHDISLKILHQAGFETARQPVTLAKLRALAIAPRPSLSVNPSVQGHAPKSCHAIYPRYLSRYCDSIVRFPGQFRLFSANESAYCKLKTQF